MSFTYSITFIFPVTSVHKTLNVSFYYRGPENTNSFLQQCHLLVSPFPPLLYSTSFTILPFLHSSKVPVILSLQPLSLSSTFSPRPPLRISFTLLPTAHNAFTQPPTMLQPTRMNGSPYHE